MTYNIVRVKTHTQRLSKMIEHEGLIFLLFFKIAFDIFIKKTYLNNLKTFVGVDKKCKKHLALLL